MALRDILLKNDPLLHKPCREVTDFGKKTSDLIDDLMDTVVAADGYGLAAPQIGTLRRVFVVMNGDKHIPMVNPVILSREGEVVSEEGCLSCPGEYGTVARPQKVVVRAQDRNGEFFEMTCEDMMARGVCHECDHLEGHLYTELATEMFDEEPTEESMKEKMEQVK